MTRCSRSCLDALIEPVLSGDPAVQEGLDLSQVSDKFRQQCIENVHVIELGIGNFDERRDDALQIQQRMHLDFGLCLAKRPHGTSERHRLMVEKSSA